MGLALVGASVGVVGGHWSAYWSQEERRVEVGSSEAWRRLLFSFLLGSPFLSLGFTHS